MADKHTRFQMTKIAQTIADETICKLRKCCVENKYGKDVFRYKEYYKQLKIFLHRVKYVIVKKLP